jgi:methyl-accepting chemotaxis protein
MRFDPLAFFTVKYADSSLQVRKKSRILATMGVTFGLISVLFSVLMAVTRSVVPSFVFAGLVVFCAAVLALLRAEKYHVASSAFLYGMMAAMFIAIKFGEYASNVYNTYVMGTLGCFLLVVTALVADRPVQAIVIGVLNLASIETIYWVDCFPNDHDVVTTLAIQNLSVSSLMTILGAGIAAYLVRMTTQLLGEVEREAVKAERSYDELNTAMTQAQRSSQRIGESLAESVARTSDSISELRAAVLGIGAGMDELDGALDRSGEANRKADGYQGEVRKALAAYSEQVGRASAAIEEMAAAAGSLASQASKKKEAVIALVETSRAGEGMLSSTTASIELIKDSSTRLAELAAIIGDVADRTNLLGMNASIEAAHAGSAGKGFAVVANEIRSLSVEAGKSARVIGETLREVQQAVSLTAEKSSVAFGSFQKISEGIRDLSRMIDELLSSIRELSSGSAEVVQAVEAVADLTRSTEVAVDRSGDGMRQSLEGMDAVAEIASKVRAETSEMAERFDAMRQDSDEVRKLGGENLGTIQALRASLDGFSRQEGAARDGPPEVTRGVRVKSRAR